MDWRDRDRERDERDRPDRGHSDRGEFRHAGGDNWRNRDLGGRDYLHDVRNRDFDRWSSGRSHDDYDRDRDRDRVVGR